MTTSDSAPFSFQDSINDALDGDLPMWLFREDAKLAVYAGLWSVWRLNEQKTVAKVVLATVVKQQQAAAAPPGPLPLQTFQWIILQLQTFDDEAPVWDGLTKTLATEFTRQLSQTRPCREKQQLQYDPSTDNMKSRQIMDSTWLASVELVQAEDSGDQNDGRARPQAALNRQRVEYTLPEFENVRMFVEHPVPKQPLQKKMNRTFGLSQQSNLLAGLNEWKTWLVVDVQ